MTWLRWVGLVAWLSNAAWAHGPRVMLDPGHGGAQKGAFGVAGVWEKNIALDVCRELAEVLSSRLQAEVLWTRQDDVAVSLHERVESSVLHKPDVFISIHANSTSSKALRRSAQGMETYFLSQKASGAQARATAERENNEGVPKAKTADALSVILQDLKRNEAHADSARLAYAVHALVVAKTGAVDRGVQQAPFFVLTGIDAPAILLEIGFVTHPQEGRKLLKKSYQRQVAEAIAEGVRAYWVQGQSQVRTETQP